MDPLFLIAGLIITTIGFIEGLWTTIWVDGNSAPLTGRLTTGIWKLYRAIVGRERHKALSLAGPLILVTTVTLWLILIVLGWSFIFYADATSIHDPSTKEYPDLIGHIWYITYVMFSVGNGDFIPTSSAWQLLSSLVAFSGLGMFTLSITYLLQVLAAVVSKRSFSSQVTSIGKGPEDFVTKQWTGDGFGDIELQLSSLSTALGTLAEQHMAYPILHYYHSAQSQKANAVALTILDEALTIIRYGVPEKYHPAGTILISTRNSTRSFLDTLQGAYIKPSDGLPPSPDLSRLRDKGVPTVSDEDFKKQLDGLQERRKLLYGYLQNSAWVWPPIKEDE